jgi:hypothetical protein
VTRAAWRSTPARTLVPLAVALAAVAGSCTTISTNPSVVTALEFDSLPYPAVVTGDTLRDSLGHAAPLHAVAFNGAGAVIPNTSVGYLALDSGLTIDPSGIVTAQLRSGTVRVIASAPGLQSEPETLIVARRPDSVVATPPVVDTLLYVLPDNPAANTVSALALRVATHDTAGGIAGTRGWLVSYQLIFHGRALALTDTTVAALWTPAGKPSRVDTTAADGTASRTLRVWPAGLPTATESLTVVATVRYRGSPVPGSPVTYLIQLRPLHP